MLFEISDVLVNGSLLAVFGSAWVITVSYAVSKALQYLDTAFDKIADRRNGH